MTVRYVGLNLETGEFTNSCTEAEHNRWGGDTLLQYYKGPLKLIKYECVSDDEFDFNIMMRIISNNLMLDERRKKVNASGRRKR
jgi:hypothetical protein